MASVSAVHRKSRCHFSHVLGGDRLQVQRQFSRLLTVLCHLTENCLRATEKGVGWYHLS